MYNHRVTLSPTLLRRFAIMLGLILAGETIFALPGVKSVFATANFVTITKEPAADWTGIVDSATETLSIAF